MTKDYLTTEEAAAYCCVSDSQFRRLRAEHGLRPMPWMGKLVYRRADLKAAMDREWDRQWRQSIKEVAAGTSSGGKGGGSTAVVSGRFRARPRRVG